MRGGEGTVTVVHYFEKEEFGAKNRLCARLIIPPGAGIGEHKHEGEDEVYLVIKGTGLPACGMKPSEAGAFADYVMGKKNTARTAGTVTKDALVKMVI